MMSLNQRYLPLLQSKPLPDRIYDVKIMQTTQSQVSSPQGDSLYGRYRCLECHTRRKNWMRLDILDRQTCGETKGVLKKTWTVGVPRKRINLASTNNLQLV